MERTVEQRENMEYLRWRSLDDELVSDSSKACD